MVHDGKHVSIKAAADDMNCLKTLQSPAYLVISCRSHGMRGHPHKFHVLEFMSFEFMSFDHVPFPPPGGLVATRQL